MKKKVIIGIIVLFVLAIIGVGLYFLLRDKKEAPQLSDAERFAEEYTGVNSDNVFVYRNAEEIIRILKNGTGVVYLGFAECKWCQKYVTYLNEFAKYRGISRNCVFT